MKKLLFLFILMLTPALANAVDNQQESLYGEWRLVGWYDGGIWFEVDTNYVSHHHMGIEIKDKEEGYTMAYSMVNEIFVGLLTLNGNEMIFDGEYRGVSTKVLGTLNENLFFEDHICDIKFYQLEGKQLKLYYTDNDYFVFTKDFDDSQNLPYAWYNGVPDPYVAEVMSVTDEEVTVNTLHSPSYASSYVRHPTPTSQVVCHFAASDLATLSFEVGDKIAFKIVKHKRIEGKREFLLKVEPCKGSEYMTNKAGMMHKDNRMGWMIVDVDRGALSGVSYLYPMKTLPETYQKEGLSVIFSGDLYPTWLPPTVVIGGSDFYYVSIDAIEPDSQVESVPIDEAHFPDSAFRARLIGHFDWAADSVLTKTEAKWVRSLDFSDRDIKNLKGIEYFTNLIDLRFSGKNLEEVDLSKNTELVFLKIENTKLSSIDLSNNLKLNYFSLKYNLFNAIDLSKNTELGEFYLNGNQLTSLDLTGLKKLAYIDISCNHIKGKEMDKLIASLSSESPKLFYVINTSDSKEENVVTKSQVAALQAKGWKVYQWNNGQSSTYLGSDPTDDYHPLIEEGKHWTYDNFMPLRPSEYDHYYYYDLRGDTLIAGQQCLKMYSENLMNNSEIKYQGSLFEENKKVYYFSPGKEKAELLYDFDCFVGDTLHVRAGDLVVKDIQTEDNGGIAIKRYTLYETNDMLDISWIEGVGASTDFFGMMPYPGNYNTLNACELNGEKLYQTIKKDPAEEGYHKMGIEGKRWNYIHYYIDNDGEHFDPYWYVVKGDTIIRRTNYKILYYQDEKTERPVCLLREVGREVFKCDFGDNSYDTPLGTSFFHFGRDDFGRVFSWKAKMEAGNTNWMVYNVDTIKVNNRFFRRYTCLQKYSEEGQALTTIEDGDGVWHDIWVEGIGSASSGIEDQNPNHEPPVRTTSDYTYFVSCYENGECIFTADDFNVQTYTKPDVNIAYRPFIEEGKVWKVGTSTTIVDNSVQVVDYYYFDGDTIIGGKTCKQMMCQRYVSPNYSNEYWTPRPSLTKVGAWYEEDKKVYSFDERQQTMTLKYDFSLEANDTLHFLNVDGFPPFIIGPKQTGGIEGFKGVYREIMIGQDTHNTIWLEGVGVRDAPFRNAYDPRADLVPEFLMSCTVGDEIIYLNDRYEDGATPESMGARKNRFDFTHTIKTKPKARKRSEEEPLLYGEYNDLKLGINLNPLDDAYQVRITDDSGKIVYEKAINAGNIVGLNIDISAYSKGRYTVTVENSDESFTGEFNAQGTGIESITSNKVETRPSIYNLQGQRLSSLQKGLNIVNGQKIFVK
jgi:hypothetical protein